MTVRLRMTSNLEKTWAFDKTNTHNVIADIGQRSVRQIETSVTVILDPSNCYLHC